MEGVLAAGKTAERLAALTDLFSATPTGRNFFKGFTPIAATRCSPRPVPSTTWPSTPLLLGAPDHTLGEHYQLCFGR